MLDARRKIKLCSPLVILVILYMFVAMPESIEVEAWRAIFIFLAVIYLWVTETFHLATTAIIGLTLFLITGTSDTSTVLSGFGSTAFFVILVGFGIATGLVASGLDKRIAHQLILHSKTEKTLLIWVMMLTALLSLIMSNTTTVIVMIPILRHVVQKTKFNKILLFLALAFSANVGGVGFLIGSPPNVIAAEALGIGFNQWLIIAFPFMLVMLVLLYFSFNITFKPKTERAKIPKDHKLGPITFKEKMAGIIVGVTLLLWLTSRLHGLSTVAVGLIGTVAMFFLVYEWKQFQENTDWGILFLMGGAISIGAVLMETGAAKWVAESFLSLTGTEYPLLIIFGFVVLSLAITQFIQNTATAAVFAPLLFSMAPGLGIDAQALVIPMAIGVSMTFLFPPGTAPNAIVFSEAKIKTKEMFKAGLLPTAFALVLLFVLSYVLLRVF